jgi:hypothetical protein
MSTDTFTQLARNDFIRGQLSLKGYSPKEYMGLWRPLRQNAQLQLEQEFKDGFFEYCRDRSWMQQAEGPCKAWMDINGIIPWHIKAAVDTLVYQDEQLGM